MTIMGRRALALLLGLVLVGCTRTIEDAIPQKQRPIGPIGAGQVEDLVSKNGRGGDAGASLYAKVEPADCAGLVQEVRAPFVFDAKAAASAEQAWDDGDAGIVEIVGVYHSDFSATTAIDRVRRTVESCTGEELRITASSGATVELEVQPRSDSDSPQIVLWSLTKTEGEDCDDAFVAAHNAAVEITTCWQPGGYDVLALAHAALKRIDAAADTTS